MTYVITRSCCNDASCVPVCPVNCIHPTPGEPGFSTAEMLYIDPDVCIECGACLDACPVSAIYPSYELPTELTPFEQINAAYYDEPGARDYSQTPLPRAHDEWSGPAQQHPLRVAIIGAGPSAFYVADALLGTRGLTVQVDVFERLPTPFGLIRHGVAPDHQQTKAIADVFSALLGRAGFRIFLNTEVGRDVSREQLAESYDAVVYATGASIDRRLGIDGEDLPGSHSGADFVAWYNGHPDHADREFDLSGERAVVVGNGNVALDIARILTSDIGALERTDIADHALQALRESKVREVVVLGRRGAADAAFTTPELVGLAATPGIHVRVEGAEELPDGSSFTERLKLQTLAQIADREPREGDRTVTLRFFTTVDEILGTEHTTGVRLATAGVESELTCGLIMRSIGYRAAQLAGLPQDEERGTVRHQAGRILADDDGTAPTYAVGWLKRGPRGVIGSNRDDARETVDTLLVDLADGRVRPRAQAPDLAEVLPDALDATAWRLIDKHERSVGRAQGRPRAKLVTVEQVLSRIRQTE